MIIAEMPERIKIPVVDASGEPILDDDGNIEKWIETTVVMLRNVEFYTQQGEQMEGTQIVSYDRDGFVHGNDIKEVKIIKTRKNAKIRSKRNTNSKRSQKRRSGNQRRDNNPGNKETDKTEGDGAGLRKWDEGKADGSKKE